MMCSYTLLYKQIPHTNNSLLYYHLIIFMPLTDITDLFMICLFGVLRRFQHCTGHITTGSWKGRGNQYIEFTRVVYCKLPTNGKQLPAFPLTAMMGIEPRPQRWEARVLPLSHRGPDLFMKGINYSSYSHEFTNLRFVDEVPHFTHYKCSYPFDLIDWD